MLDRWTLKIIQSPLRQLADLLKKNDYNANQVTIVGFSIGLATIPVLAFHLYWLALTCIILNRTFDGIDGALARITATSEAGAYLDIVLDFIFYSAVVFGFVLAAPATNGLSGCALLFSFAGNGSSFLAFAIMAKEKKIKDVTYPQKGFYYLGGLTEGTETVICFTLFCLFPDYFPVLAFIFAGMCTLTAIFRVVYGFRTLAK